MPIEQLDLLTGLNKVDFAISLIKEHEPVEGYYLAFSGGKDSVVLKDLTDKAGVKYEAYYHPSPLDPPELIKFIKQYYKDVVFAKPPMPFWKAFNKKSFPLRNRRWCCEYIKEWGGSGRTCLLGLRSEESRNRAKRQFVELDNHKTRFNPAPRIIINPLLVWSTYDIWQYIRMAKLPYCSLYDEGFERIACVMCPLASPETRLREYYRFPKIALAWYRAFERIYEIKRDNYSQTWANANELFWWWMGSPDKAYENNSYRLFD